MKELTRIIRRVGTYSNILFVPEEELWPLFGKCSKYGTIRIRDNMSDRLTLGIVYHELAHRAGHGEIVANLLTMVRNPPGFCATVLASLIRWYRIRLYWHIITKGSSEAVRIMRNGREEDHEG